MKKQHAKHCGNQRLQRIKHRAGAGAEQLQALIPAGMRHAVPNTATNRQARRATAVGWLCVINIFSRTAAGILNSSAMHMPYRAICTGS